MKTNKVGLNTNIYNKDFYEEMNREKNVNRGAAVVCPMLIDILNNAGITNDKPSVADVGCGTGVWLSEFKNLGCKVHGYDGNEYYGLRNIDENEFTQINLTKNCTISDTYDIAMSLEVAEHIPEEYSDNYLRILTGLSDVILFSAAIPFQMGQGHVNERYPSYWVMRFKEYGYECIDIIRERIWNETKILHYYKQNILLFVKSGDNGVRDSFIQENKKPVIDIIHPDTWEKVQSWLPVRIMVAAYNNPKIYNLYAKMKKHDKRRHRN